MLYFAVTSNSFRKSSLDELNKISRFKILDEFLTSIVIESEERDFIRKLREANPVFIYNMVPLNDGREKIAEENYLETLYKKATDAIPETGKIKLECVDLNCKTSYSAKEIEIYMGEKLESEGRTIDLKKPDYLAYIIMVNNHCYSGFLEYEKMWKPFVEPERHYHQNSKYPISRSELKLIQAFDEFAPGNGKIAIDLGAAPGGWTNFLIRSGYKVVAVDNGLLDYPKFEEKGIRFKVVPSGPANPEDLEQNELIHIKANARELQGLGADFKADLIVNDMNMAPEDSVSVLLPFSINLCEGAKMVMTIKCINRKAEFHLHKAEKALVGRFKIISVRCLPSNRQELTLYAIYLGNTGQTTA